MSKLNADNLHCQAREGSVTAIIQILNDQLSTMAVRTRAVLNQNILHVLCEGQELDRLGQEKIVLRVKEILETIAPINFKKAQVYGRLAKEEQVLWFEAIQSNPDREVLWSEKIKLKQPKLLERWHQKEATPVKLTRDVELIGNFSKKEKMREKSQLEALMNRDRDPIQPWLMPLGIGIGLIGLLGAAIVQGWGPFVGIKQAETSVTMPDDIAPPADAVSTAEGIPSTSSSVTEEKPAEQGTVNNSIEPSPPTHQSSPSNNAPSPKTDSFHQAVSIANEMTVQGLEAQTPEQWLKVSAGWQQASDLMGLVSPDHPRFTEAQQKVKEYQQNQQITLAQAKKSLSR